MSRTRTSLIAIVALGAAIGAPAASRGEGFRIVVNGEHPGDAVTRQVLADVFLRRATRWSDGGPIQVVDQSLKSEVRVEFTEEVLELTSMAVMSYWQQQLLRGGERPPAVKPSDAEVLEFVAKTRGAIGYVSAEAEALEGVKVLEVVE
jgi:ABC-type phosphate transport system substrate-binding protein